MEYLKISRVFLKISQGFLYLALLTPLLVFRNLYFPFVSGKIIFFRIAVELALLFYLLAFLIESNQPEFKFRKLFKNPIFLSVLIFSLLFFLSSFWGINPKFSLFSNYERGDGGLQMLHYFIFFFLLVSLFRKPSDWKKFFIASVVVSLSICFYALGQFNEAKCLTNAGSSQALRQACQPGTFLAANARVSGTLGNSSYLAVYALFHLFFLGYLFLNPRVRFTPYIWGAIALFEFLILLLTQTRGVFLGLLAAILLWALITIFYAFRTPPLFLKKRAGQFILVALGAVAIFLVLLSVFSIGHPNSVAARFIKALSPTYVKDSLKDRFWTWGTAIASIVERPFGWGAENFPQAFDKYYNPKFFGVESWFDRAHNIYLDYALIGGIPLLIAFLSIFYFVYRQLFKQFKKNLLLPASMFILITTYLIQGLVLFDVISTYLVLFLFLAFAIGYFGQAQGVNQEVLSSRKTSGSAVKLVAAPLIISTFFAFYWLGFLPYQRSALLVKAIQKSQQESFENISSNFEPALHHRSPVGNNESFLALAQLSQSYLNSLYKDEIPVAKNSLDSFMHYLSNEFSKKEKSNDLIGTRPLLYFGWLNFHAGRITKDSYYFQKSAEYFNKGLQLSPTRMEFIYANLELALAAKDQETAKSMLMLASRFRPDLEQTNRYYQELYEATFETNQ